MKADTHQKKIGAIYDLRAAVETEVHAEHAVDQDRSAESKGAYLNAIVRVEEKTQDAIDACTECGHPHPKTEPHRGRVTGLRGNVIDVDFRVDTEDERGSA
jgi:hypothetical protein